MAPQYRPKKKKERVHQCGNIPYLNGNFLAAQEWVDYGGV